MKHEPGFRGDTPEQTRHRVEKISESEEEAYKILIPRHRESAIQLDDFEGVVGPEEIERDKEAIKKKKSGMEDIDSASHRRAQLLEALLTEQIELSDWFGDNVMTIIPSEYDDLFNGIDLAVEFEKDGFFNILLWA